MARSTVSSLGSSAVGECRKGQLFKIIVGYELKNTHNPDETGLFYRLLPNKILCLKGDPCKVGRIPRGG
jgi:hypothetical protein